MIWRYTDNFLLIFFCFGLSLKISALYLQFLQKTWQVIYRLMKTELDKFMANVPIQLVRQLYEFENANPDFGEPMTSGKMVCVTVRFTCNGEICSVNGLGVNKDNAKRAAAKLALSKLTRS